MNRLSLASLVALAMCAAVSADASTEAPSAPAVAAKSAVVAPSSDTAVALMTGGAHGCDVCLSTEPKASPVVVPAAKGHPTQEAPSSLTEDRKAALPES